jgi:tagatose 6-phosphate kinase
MIITLGTTPTIQRSMTFKRIVIDEVNRAVAVREYASGKSINVARVLSTIGMAVGAVSIVGGDRGIQMRRDMARSKINHTFIDSATETRLCTTLIDESNNTATELVEEARPIEKEAFEALWKTVETLFGVAKGLVISGTLAPGAGDDFYSRYIREANKHGVPTVLDARGEALKLALPERPFVVKPNRLELAQTVGHAVDSPDALRIAVREMISMGAQWVVVTGGGTSPTIVSNGSDFWQVSVPKVDVVSPIGSGDSFAAGLMAAIKLEQTVPDACKLATACAAANAMTADAGHVHRDDVEALWKQVEVREWVVNDHG